MNENSSIEAARENLRRRARSLTSLFASVAVTILFCALMYSEWLHKNQASFLFGPLHCATDVAPENVRFGIFLSIVLVPMMFAYLVKPHWTTAVLSLIGILSWLFLGVICEGISC